MTTSGHGSRSRSELRGPGMNDATLKELEAVVERTVAPVRTTLVRKRQMREELLAHLVSVFEQAAVRLGDETLAVQEAKSRFGDPVELSGQLQESVPWMESASMRKWCSKKSAFLVLAPAVCLVALFAVEQARNRSGAQLEFSIARMPTGITAREADRMVGGHPDRTVRESGVLVNSVCMLAAENPKAKEYGIPRDYELHVWQRGPVKASVAIDGDGLVAGRWTWK